MIDPDLHSGVEIAVLQSPWPDWLRIDDLDPKAAVVDVASSILSPEINNNLAPEEVCKLVQALMGPDTVVHAWINADMDYQASVLRELDRDSVRAFFPLPRDCGELADISELKTALRRNALPALSFGILAISCRVCDLISMGLPGSFLAPMGWQDRIGFAPKPRVIIGEDHCPSLNEVLNSYEVMLIPGGEHSSECLLTSTSLSQETLLDRVKLAAGSLGWKFKSPEVVKEADYEELYGDLASQLHR